MKRGVALGLTSVVALAAATPLMPRVASANTCGTPTVSGVTATAPGSSQVLQHHGPAGSSVTVSGSGFRPAALGCTTTVAVGGAAPQSVNVVSDTVITFTSTANLSGPVVVSLTDSLGPVTDASNHQMYVTDPAVNGLDNTTPNAGSAVHLLGQGFTFGNNVPGVTATASYRWAAGPSNGNPCGGASSSSTVADDQHVALAVPSQYCDGSVAVTFTVPVDVNKSSTFAFATAALSASFDINANPTGMSRTSAVPGQTVTVSGSGFGNQGGTASVAGHAATVQSWSDTAVTAVVPQSATSGAFTFARAVDSKQFNAPQSLTVSGSVSSVSPSQGAVGDTITVNGAGFGTQAGSVSIAGTAATVQSWSPSSIAFTVPDGLTPGGTTITISTNGTSAPAPPAFTALPRITGLTPAHAPAGSVIEIDGTTFGTQQGTVQVGGQDATVTVWGDKSVVVELPASLAPGSSTVTLTPVGTSYGATSPYTIDTPPPPGSSGSGSGSGSGSTGGSASGGSGSSGSGGSAHTSPVPGTPGAQVASNGLILPNPSGPIIAHGPVQFTKPSPPPGPVSLKLDAKDAQSDPGTDVPFTVTLTAFGKPVVGAPVDLLLVIEPGSDAALNPAKAVTNAQGQVTGTIHLSRTAGDHIVLARSGIYSDEVRVVGRGANATVASGRVGPAGGGSPVPPLVSVRSPVLWALIACILLFGAGFGLNLVTAPAVGGAGATVGRERSAREAMIDVATAAGSMVRYGASLVAVVASLGLGALRRRG